MCWWVGGCASGRAAPRKGGITPIETEPRPLFMPPFTKGGGPLNLRVRRQHCNRSSFAYCEKTDIVVANRGGNEHGGANYICMNDGRGHFPSCRQLSTESATTIAAGDINGDGLPDLVVPHRDGGQSYIFINDGKGGFAEKHPFGPAKSATRAIALGDLNGDGAS